MKISVEQKYENNYIRIKTLIGRLLKRKKYQRACDLIKYCCNYKYFVNDIYYDQDLEYYCRKISQSLCGNITKQQNRSEMVLFYDQLSRDGRVLSTQYLQGLHKSGKEIIYVYYEDNELNTRLRAYCKENNIKMYSLGLRYDLDSLRELVRIYKLVAPSVVITQCHVDDYVGAIFNYSIFKSDIMNIFINISDHTFWLGQGAYKTYIEFRDYGYSVTTEKRDISADRLVKLPYYAVDSVGEFHGFDSKLNNKKIILSGGATYKIQGKPDFFGIINSILGQYEDCAFLYLTNGDKDYVLKGINREFHERVVVSNERNDLDEIMKRTFMYINTYPICGALMSLYAAKNSLMPFTIYNKEDPINDLRDFFTPEASALFLFPDAPSLVKAIDDYYHNADQYTIDCKLINEDCINKSKFDAALSRIIENNQNEYAFKRVQVDYDKITRVYMKNIETRMKDICFSSRSIDIFIRFPLTFLSGAFSVLKSKGLTFFVKKTKKYLMIGK